MSLSADAYFTVEAALVVPVALAILIFLLYLSFYLYDRCVMAQDCCVLCYRQSIEKGKENRISREKIREQFGEKLFMLTGQETNASDGGTIRICSSVVMNPPLFGLPVFEEEKQWAIRVEKKAKKTDPPRDYRRVRRVLAIAAKAVPGDSPGTP